MIEERSTIRAIGAAIVLLGGVIAIPVLLATQFGWPLPHAVPVWDEVSTALTQSVSDEIVLKVFAVAAWIVWLIFTVTVIEETVAAMRGSNRRLVSVGPLQVFVASLVAAIVLALPTNIKVGTSSPEYSLAVATQTVSSAPPLTASATPKPVLLTESPPQTVSYTVVHRDTLWAISARYLGDGTRWHEIWALNKDAKQSDGRVFSNPAKIHPGWTIQLPAEAKASNTVSTQPAVTEPSPEISPLESPPEQPDPPLDLAAPAMPQAEATPKIPAVTSIPAASPETEAHNATVTTNETNAYGGITLASGGLVGATLASGIGAALVAARLRRRRLYVPTEPKARVATADRLLTDTVKRLRTVDLAHKADVGEIDDIFAARAHRPGTVTVAASGTGETTIDLTSVGGMSFDATDDLDQARALVLGFIGNLPPEDAEVVIVGETLASELLGNQRSFPGFRVEADGEAVLIQADADMLTRTRLLTEGDYEDIDAFRIAHPIESIPARLIVVTSGDSALVGRAKAIATAGKKLGIGVVFIDGFDTADSASGAAIAVPRLRDVARLDEGDLSVHVNQQEAGEVVAVIEAARSDAQPDKPESDNTESVVEDSVIDGESSSESSKAPVDLCLFGPSRVLINGVEPKRAVRRQVRELMTLLALRPLGATADAAGAAIWPETNQLRAQQRIRNLHGSANTDLRALTGLQGDFIERAGERYRLNRQLIDCDWWRFERAIATSKDNVDALQSVIDECDGDIAEGADWLWIDVVREDARRQLLSACSRVAEIRSRNGDVIGACGALQHACKLDPYNEAVHRKLMKLQVDLGKHAEAERTYALLEERLNTDLGVQVSEQTRQLFDQLDGK